MHRSSRDNLWRSLCLGIDLDQDAKGTCCDWNSPRLGWALFSVAPMRAWSVARPRLTAEKSFSLYAIAGAITLLLFAGIRDRKFKTYGLKRSPRSPQSLGRSAFPANRLAFMAIDRNCRLNQSMQHRR